MSTNPEAPWTIARLIAWTRQYFERAGLDAPRLCAEILLAHALGCERIELYTRHETVPPADVLARYRELVRQAAQGRPIAYLTGTKEFFSLSFKVTEAVLIPRPETEVLVERVIHLARHSDQAIARICDVGTGSGCIAIALAHNLPELVICASDISPAALAVARENAERLAVGGRIEFREGDLLEPWRDQPPFDLIASNPPYISEAELPGLPANVRDHEPRAALLAGPDGLAVHRRLIAQAPDYLRPGGHLLLEVAFDQAPAVVRLLDESGWRDIVTYRDTLQHERVVHARRPG